eukprot:scaffold119318_cov42-Cyclotella_meneghiniana.AAC.3
MLFPLCCLTWVPRGNPPPVLVDEDPLSVVPFRGGPVREALYPLLLPAPEKIEGWNWETILPAPLHDSPLHPREKARRFHFPAGVCVTISNGPKNDNTADDCPAVFLAYRTRH